MIYPWHYYLMATLYIGAGLLHFFKSPWYLPVLPKRVPAKLLVVHLSGILEIYLGILLLLPSWKPIALWGIILMLLFYLPVHIVMVRNPHFRKRFPGWVLWLRLPVQFLLMYWAWSYL
jgi:uncharacterized membrane protein